MTAEPAEPRSFFGTIVRGAEPHPDEAAADAVLTITPDGFYRVVRNRYGPAGEEFPMSELRRWTDTMQARKESRH